MCWGSGDLKREAQGGQAWAAAPFPAERTPGPRLALCWLRAAWAGADLSSRPSVGWRV